MNGGYNPSEEYRRGEWERGGEEGYDPLRVWLPVGIPLPYTC